MLQAFITNSLTTSSHSGLSLASFTVTVMQVQKSMKTHNATVFKPHIFHIALTFHLQT
jgi:hypothetical protein